VKIKIFDEEFECERYEKSDKALKLYDAQDTCTVSVGGISSFEGFLVDGVPITELAESGGAE
jgi:hypothetical protein